MQNLTDTQLLDTIGSIESQIKQMETTQDGLKAELLRRMRESGEVNIATEEWESTLKKSPISLAWLKREYGYEANDLPDGIIGEKIVPDLNPAALVAWLEQDGTKVEQPYTVSIKRKKAKF